MATPQARVHLHGNDLLILGTVAGFVADAERVRQAYDAFRPTTLALGIPPEDLTALDHLAAAGDRAAFDGLDEGQTCLLDLLAQFGPTRIPSPDLEAAHACARADGIPLRAVDLDDAQHASLFTRHVKFWHVVQSNRIKSRLLKHGVSGHDAYEVAIRWDDAWNKPAGLRRLEAAREAHMAQELAAAARAGSVLAIVPAERLAGIVQVLGQR